MRWRVADVTPWWLAALSVAPGALAAFAAPVLGGESADCSPSPVTLAMPSRTTRPWTILPAFQVRLSSRRSGSRWRGVGRSWRRSLAGLGGVVLVQTAFGLRR